MSVLAELVAAAAAVTAAARAAEPGPQRFEDALGERLFVLEAVYEGYLLHYGEPRPFAGMDDGPAPAGRRRALRLGLARLAERGDLPAVAELSRPDLALGARLTPRAAGTKRRGALGGQRACGGRAAIRLPPPCSIAPIALATKSHYPSAAEHSDSPVADPPKFDKKSRYTEGRGIAGAFEGETVSRRRFMRAAPRPPAASRSHDRAAGARLRARPDLRGDEPESWQDVGPEEDFNKRPTCRR